MDKHYTPIQSTYHSLFTSNESPEEYISELTIAQKISELSKERILEIARELKIPYCGKLNKDILSQEVLLKHKTAEPLIDQSLKEHLLNRIAAQKARSMKAKLYNSMKMWHCTLLFRQEVSVIFRLDGYKYPVNEEQMKIMMLDLKLIGIVVGIIPLRIRISYCADQPTNVWRDFFSMVDFEYNFEFKIRDNVCHTFDMLPGYYHDSRIGWVARIETPFDEEYQEIESKSKEFET